MIAIKGLLICVLGSQISTKVLEQTIKCDSIYTMVDDAPMFRNGYEDLIPYLKNLNFESCGLNETVILKWTIDSSGQMIDIDAPGLEGECKSRIIEQLAKFPKWTPAKVMGVPVCFKMTVKSQNR